MKLDRVDIQNFRSIKEATISFRPRCRVLIGINESGKSNVLRALSLLNEEQVPARLTDVREPLPTEPPVTEAWVRFIFRFEKRDSDELLKRIMSVVGAVVERAPFAERGNTELSLRDFCDEFTGGLYEVDLMTGKRIARYWSFKHRYRLLPGWSRPSTEMPDEYEASLVTGKSVTLHDKKAIRSVDFSDVPDEYLVQLTIDDVERLVGNVITSITSESLPTCVLWEYDDSELLLPNRVETTGFAAEPDTCAPLKNMFLLAGVGDVGGDLTKASKDTPNRFQNYLDRIAQKTTKHFRDVWKEYKTVEFTLRQNGTHIIPGIKERNVHDFARRSDGFKRFVSFLLTISVNIRTSELKDILLLVDEPEIGLHPSGARYLRDELIKISTAGNDVVYSTHSIFMIDAGDIGRHLIVKKKNEITTLVDAEDTTVADEEVLFNALGHSVFSVLKLKNLIFEGWKDKHLFKIALPYASQAIQRRFKDVGISHARGVKSIKNITPLIELAERECVIVSDNDSAAREHKKVYEHDHGYGKWFTYKDIDPSINAVTGEDFLRNEFLARVVREHFDGTSLPKLAAADLPPEAGKLEYVKKWLIKNGTPADQAQAAIGDLKERLFREVEYSDIDSTYAKVLNGLDL